MTSTPEVSGPAVSALLADHPDGVAATARRVRAVLLGAHPQLVERVRLGWHSINYRDPAAGFVCAIFPTAERVQLVFERGARLPDPERLLTGSGTQVRQLVFDSEADVDPDVVTRYLDHAVELGAALRARRRAAASERSHAIRARSNPRSRRPRACS